MYLSRAQYEASTIMYLLTASLVSGICAVAGCDLDGFSCKIGDSVTMDGILCKGDNRQGCGNHSCVSNELTSGLAVEATDSNGTPALTFSWGSGLPLPLVDALLTFFGGWTLTPIASAVLTPAEAAVI